LPGIASISGTDSDFSDEWQLGISDSFDPQEILRFCAEKNLGLSRFEFTEPSLHDVFVHLVGDDAREHQFR